MAPLGGLKPVVGNSSFVDEADADTAVFPKLKPVVGVDAVVDVLVDEPKPPTPKLKPPVLVNPKDGNNKSANFVCGLSGQSKLSS